MMKKLIFLLVVFLLFSFSTTALASTQKLLGIDRYETSAQIALNGWNRSMFAILVPGDNFPDAISAAPLAKYYSAPILLTKKDYIPTDILNAIKQLEITDMIIVGGTGVITTSVESELISLGIRTSRIDGRDRYETSVNIAKHFKISNKNDISEIAIVTGEDFADALSIAPIAANKHMPILLVQHNKIPDDVKEFLDTCKPTKTYVVGAGSSLDKSLLDELPNVEQINGMDKYQRNLAIIDQFKSELALDSIYLTTGEDYADGLSGAALASIRYNPIVLVGENAKAPKDYLDNNSITNYNLVVLGGRVNNMELISSPTIDFEEKKISDVAKINFNDITKIVFYDGRGGLNKPLIIDDEQNIKEFISYLDAYVIKKTSDPNMVGWIHEAVFYDKNNVRIMDVTFRNPIEINKQYYDVVKGDLDTNKIDAFLKSVEPSWRNSR
ncbi:cell wall-binding repeat-containing protein [Desulfitobacterium hafniense]|nr:cell wall-binding repeat-containing protein [Desulfitobacterium hafniense]